MNCANHPDRERKAFCQNCGKPLCAECARVVGQAVFCEPCLEQRLAAANAAASPLGSAFGGPTPGTPAGSAAQDIPFSAGAGTPPPAGGYRPVSGSGPATPPPPAPGAPAAAFADAVAGTPNPGLAFLLGLIPGVGAMYNGQYAKGVVHLVVFAILVSLSDQNGIFGLFVAGWIFYQAIEAHHTARARRDGTPLPNPFGLNDVGERLGFGRTWAAPATPFQPANDPARTAANPYAAPAAAAPPVQETTGWGSATDTYAAPYAAVPPAASPLPSPGRAASFPFGAVALIGLGALFLLGNTRWLGRFSVQFLLPILLIGSGVWLFFRRMSSSGPSLADDGSPFYRLRVIRALQGSVWILLVGVLFLLDNLRVLTWNHSWPLFIIVGGALALLRRSAYSAVPPVAPFYPTAPATPPPTPAESALVPREREDN